MPNFPVEVLNTDSGNFAFNNGEGEHDNELSKYFVRTNNIKTIIENVKQFPFVVAPKGVGKSALCSMIIECKQIKVRGSKNCLFMKFDDYREMIDNHRKEIGLEYCIAKTILNRIAKHLKNQFNINMFNYPDFEKMLAIIEGWSIENIEVKGKASTGILNGEIKGNYKKMGVSSENTSTDMLCAIDNFLLLQGKRVVICIDGIDDAVSNKSQNERDWILNTLYETVKYIRKSKTIVPILFIRNDLFRMINVSGEEDKLRFSKLDLNWEQNELLELIIKRFLHDENLKDIRKNIKKVFLLSKRSLSLPLNSKDLSWIEQLSNHEKLEIFYIFFPKEVYLKSTNPEVRIDFFEWLTEIFKNTNGITNVRNVIYFLKILFKIQYNKFLNNGIEHIEFIDGKYELLSNNTIESALYTIREYAINDYANLISIDDKNRHEKASLIECIINYLDYDNNKKLGNLDYSLFAFTEKQFWDLVDSLEFYGCLKRVSFTPIHTKYSLCYLFQGYSSLKKTTEQRKDFYNEKIN